MATCPVGFDPSPTNANACVAQCPSSDGFELRVRDGVPACVYTADSTRLYTLDQVNAVARINGAIPTLAELPTADKVRYDQAKSAADAKRTTLLTTIGQAKLQSDAFSALQTAENARDTAPEAYQAARTRYYTLTKGSGWLETERTRLLNAEVLPAVASYIRSINDVTERKTQQDTTLGVVGVVKSKLVSMKDDFRTTTATLSKQIDALKSQIEIDRRLATTEVQRSYDWALNLLLIALSLVVVYMLVRKLMNKASAPAPAAAPALVLAK